MAPSRARWGAGSSRGGRGRVCVESEGGSPSACNTRVHSRPHAVDRPACVRSLGACGVPSAFGPKTALQSGAAGASISAGRELRTSSFPPWAVKAAGGRGQGREALWDSPACGWQEVALWLNPKEWMSRSFRQRWQQTAEASRTGDKQGTGGHTAPKVSGVRGHRWGGEPQPVHTAAEWPQRQDHQPTPKAVGPASSWPTRAASAPQVSDLCRAQGHLGETEGQQQA